MHIPGIYTIYQQATRWIRAGVFEAVVHDLREILRLAEGRKKEPSRAIIDSQTIQSTPESEERAGKEARSLWLLISSGIFWLCM
ncbi:transposase [Candidatus Jettenia caeni]|uniref:Transposase n=1 Tax=Candidatus Jettenia caeni TaxID=247490 RepID=I3IPT8_9BACT|nr:hypothetical protein [Candidatus Jettenia caeni]GAB63733.1 transposase [Candidatus Jettenia caeni]